MKNEIFQLTSFFLIENNKEKEIKANLSKTKASNTTHFVININFKCSKIVHRTQHKKKKAKPTNCSCLVLSKLV